MLFAQIAILVAITSGLIAGYIFCKVKGIALPKNINKILSIALAVVFFFRYMWSADAMMYIVDLAESPFASSGLTALALISNWLLLSVIVLAIMFPFFKNGKTSVLLKYYGSAVVLLYISTLKVGTIGICGESVYTGFDIRAIFIAIELALLVAIIAKEMVETKAKCEKSDLRALPLILCMLAATMPAYMLAALFGYSNYSFEVVDLIASHRAFLYGAVALPLFLYFVLRNKDPEVIRGLLIYMCLGVMISFSAYYRFPDLARLADWPLHLCNTAVYIVPLCLIFKMDRLFYFTYFINVMGAAIALLMPSYSGVNIMSYNVIRFYLCHYIAFFMPILMVGLKLYKRPKLQQFKYSMVAFLAYFIAMLLANAYCTNYDPEVDFFFLNSDFIVGHLGQWAENTRNFVVSFNIGTYNFVFYPIYQTVFFIVYVFAGIGMWFLYEGMYMLEDTMIAMSEKKKAIKADRLALEVSLAGRSKEEPMNSNITDKLVLNNFSKRYGKSSVYAVKEANLEVCAGDVFGFLGHNGAGKSTIIKSIVGIQPITSGSISVCGFDVNKQSVMAKRNIGFVPDHYALYEKLSGREYLNYIADLYDVSKEDRDSAISHYIKLFNLEGSIDNQIKTYSHGMKQKVTIMSALIHNPKLWILDEPLTGLDPDSIIQVKECMREHAKKGNIVFFSSHLIDVVETVCNKIAIIAKGDIITCDNVADVLAKGRLEDYYREITVKATSTSIDDAGNLVKVDA
ncbi:MAG: YwaF family protein [Bacillota bacterium]